VTTARPSTPRSSPAAPPHARWLLAVAVLLVGLNLRTAVTSIGPLLSETQATLHLSGVQEGLLTTLPVICFAVLGALTPSIARRIGEQVTVTAALVLMAVGLATRALAHSGPAFLALSVLALAGGAIGNVTLPALVKRWFPDRVGTMTAAYTTALAFGTTAGAALSVPFADLSGGPNGWRLGLGVWSVLAAVAVLPWLALLGDRRPAGARSEHLPFNALLRSRTAWWLVLFFAAQSAQAYIAFGWFAQFFREQHLSGTRAGLLIGILAALAIPVSATIPAAAARMRTQRPLVLGLGAVYLLGYLGMLLAPVGGAFAWAVLVGIGGGAFPLALTLLALRSRTPAMTATLSAFVQSIGYVLAGIGPLLVGVLHRRPGDWGPMFVLLFILLAVMLVAGWYVAAGGPVEEEIASR